MSEPVHKCLTVTASHLLLEGGSGCQGERGRNAEQCGLHGSGGVSGVGQLISGAGPVDFGISSGQLVARFGDVVVDGAGHTRLPNRR